MAVDTYDDLEPVANLIVKCEECGEVFPKNNPRNLSIHKADVHGINQ